MSHAQDEHDVPITEEMIRNAEKLIGLSFTDSEIGQMLPSMQRRLGEYASLRAASLPNALPPALLFDPRVTATRPVDASKPIPRRYPTPETDEVELPSNLEDVAFYRVAQLAQLIRTRRLTSIQLTEIYIERIRRYAPKLECVITLTEDRAIQKAKQADEEIAAGHYRSPLHGIPWGAKDLIAARGYPTTWGAAPYREQRFEQDATVVRRLDDAGAVLVAKLSTGELAYGDKWFGGRTRNPWNTEEGSSGSSAGPVSATSAGLVGFALGTETTGSIVWPALRCGVSGLRPTFGVVSRNGVMVLSWSLDKVGPVARSIEDCALILTAIYGVDADDPFTLDAPFEWNPDTSGLRVGYVASAFEESHSEEAGTHSTVKGLKDMGIDLREHRGNDRRTLDTLRSIGFDLIPIELPKFDLDGLLMIMAAEGAAAFDELTRSDRDDLLASQEETASSNRFRQARFIPAVEFIQASRVRTQLMQAMADVMSQVDVFVVPQLADNNLSLTNLSGQPTIGAPNGFTDTGMPTGINFVGSVCGDAAMLAVANAYQHATDYHLQHPKLD